VNWTGSKALNVSHQPGAEHGGRSRLQWSTQRLPVSSRYGSQPSSQNMASANAEGTSAATLLRFGKRISSRMSKAIPQYLIALTMFFPTPSWTVASVRPNKSAPRQAPSKALRNHP